MRDAQIRYNLGLHVSESRPEGGQRRKKEYVQDRMKIVNRDDKLRKMIQEDHAYVYICGDGAGMAKDVVESLVDILGGDDREEGEKQIMELKKRKRLVLDIWSV